MMTGYEVATLGGLFAGPVMAVAVTLWSQKRTAVRDRRLTTLRMLLTARSHIADPAYSVSINMIPTEFADCAKVIAAWHAFMKHVQYRPVPENLLSHQAEFNILQTKLIFEMSRALGYKLSETDIQSSAYVAQGWTDRDSLNQEAQRAWIRIAVALEKQVGI